MANRVLTDSPTIVWDETTVGQLKARVVNSAALPAKYWDVPSGASWSTVLAKLGSAWSAGNDQVVLLPDETMVMGSAIENGAPVTLIGKGPSCVLKADTNISLYGSPVQFLTYKGASAGGARTRLANLTFEQARATVTRMTAIQVTDGAARLDIDHVNFTNITSDCITVLPIPGTAVAVFDVNVWGCIASEFYESFFNHHGGSLRDVAVYNNTAATSSRHPDGAVSSPYFLIINLEGSEGNADNIMFQKNIGTFTGTARGTGPNPAIGLLLNFSNPPVVPVYDGICFKNNQVTGPYYGAYVGTTNFGGTTNANYVAKATLNSFLQNKIQTCAGEVFHMVPHDFGLNAVRYLIMGNELITDGGGAGLVIDMSDSVGIINNGSADVPGDNDIHA